MKNSNKVVHWLPRILCILAILFVSMFAFDAFDDKLPILEQVKDFLLHLIPSYILILALLIAWKWEFYGGVLFVIIGLALTPYIYIKNYNMNHNVGMSIGIVSAISIPFIIVGILFIISYVKKKNTKD